MAFFLSILIAHPCPCQERSGMFGVEFTSITHGCAEVCASFSFDRHWTVTGEVMIPYRKFARHISSLEIEHRSEFTTSLAESAKRYAAGTGISVSYWPEEAFRGPHLSVGIASEESADIIAEAGYMVSIWKGIRLSASVCSSLLKTLSKDETHMYGIKVGIHYKF